MNLRRSWRDRLAHRLANAALRIATPWYRNMIAGAIEYGMRSAARDVAEDRPTPEWPKTPPPGFGISEKGHA